MRKYRTIQGDTFDVIAYRMYGREELMSAVIAANLEYVDYVKFPAGIVLDIPELDANLPDMLPAWKR